MCLSSNVCTLIYKNVQKIQKPYFKAFLWVLCAQNLIFMGSINLKIGISCKLCLTSNKSNEKEHLYLDISKSIPKSILSTFIVFMGPQPNCYGSLKPQNGFIK